MSVPDPEIQSVAKILRDLAHDIKVPVRGIRNYAQFLANDYTDVIDDEGKAMLDTLQRLSAQIEGYVTVMLNGFDSEDGALELEEVDLNEVLRSVQEMLLVKIRDAHAQVLVPRPLPTLTTNRAAITRVLLNLISNAIQYNDSAITVVEIGYESEPKDEDAIEIYVKDNGIGIDEGALESIFKPSIRLAPNDTREAGLGIGLSLTRFAVTQLGGEIWIQSSSDSGSTVRFTISSR